MKTALVLGAGGFIGSHLVKCLKKEGYYVFAADLKLPEFSPTQADEFMLYDLRGSYQVKNLLQMFLMKFPEEPHEIYQLAADMGGAGFIFSGKHDADIMLNSALINLNLLTLLKDSSVKLPKIFYSSSACMYPAYNQEDPNNPLCKEESAYPAEPDSEYGWEKLFSERLYLAFAREYKAEVRIARFHNIFGPEGTWTGGREKAPAALCRKVAEAIALRQPEFQPVVMQGGELAYDATNSRIPGIEIWGDGLQTRSFLYIDECIEGVRRLMESDFTGPVNIGSTEMVTINDLAHRIMHIAGHLLDINHIPGPTGVRGRNSDNTLIFEKLGWAPAQSLQTGLLLTYGWIAEQVRKQKAQQ